MSITAAVCDIARMYSGGRVSREDLSAVHASLKVYYLSMYRLIDAIEACVGPNGDACGDLDALMACVEDLCRRREKLANTLQFVWGGGGLK